jgi:hypothetical protein
MHTTVTLIDRNMNSILPNKYSQVILTSPVWWKTHRA